MTLATSINRADHIGDASTTIFAYNFRVDVLGDMSVYLNNVLQTSGYTVQDLATDAGGTVTFTTAPASGVAVALVREVAYIQDTDYTPYTKFPEDVHERALDRIVMQTQQLEELVERGMAIPGGETWDGDLPAKALRINKLLGFNLNGDPAVSSATMSDFEALVAAAAGSGVLITASTFTGDGETIAFNLTVTPPSAEALMVFIGGSLQRAVVDYTVSAAVLTFLEAPPSGAVIVAKNLGYSTGALTGLDIRIEEVSDVDVSNPPTAAELTAIFGTPASRGDGFIGLVDDNGAGTAVYMIVAKDTNWWHTLMTKAS